MEIIECRGDCGAPATLRVTISPKPRKGGSIISAPACFDCANGYYLPLACTTGRTFTMAPLAVTA